MIWRLITLMLVSLSTGMAFCHLLEMPARLDYDWALWIRVTVLEGTYANFGPPVGATLEGGAWIMAVVFAYLMRKKPTAFRFASLGAACIVAAQVAWWVFVFPVNNQMVDWTTDVIPDDFAALRNQWEYAHAARAVLQITGLGSLLLSLLHESNGRFYHAVCR